MLPPAFIEEVGGQNGTGQTALGKEWPGGWSREGQATSDPHETTGSRKGGRRLT